MVRSFIYAMRRLAFLPCLLLAGEAAAQDSLFVSFDRVLIREDGGAQDITVTLETKGGTAATEDIPVGMLFDAERPYSKYYGEFFTLSTPNLVVKKGDKKTTGTLTITPINNKRVGPCSATATECDFSKKVFNHYERQAASLNAFNDMAASIRRQANFRRPGDKEDLDGGVNIPVVFRFEGGNYKIGFKSSAEYIGGEHPVIRFDVQEHIIRTYSRMYVEIIDDDQLPSALDLSFAPSKLSKQADATPIELTGTLNGRAFKTQTTQAIETRLAPVEGKGATSDTLTRDVHYSLSGLGKLTVPQRKFDATTTFTLAPKNKAGKIVLKPSDNKLVVKLKRQNSEGRRVRIDLNLDGTFEDDGFMLPVQSNAPEHVTYTPFSISTNNQTYSVKTMGIDLNGDGDVGTDADGDGYVGIKADRATGYGANNYKDSDFAPAGTVLAEADLGIDFFRDGDYLDTYKVPEGKMLSEVGLCLFDATDTKLQVCADIKTSEDGIGETNWGFSIDFNGDSDVEDTFVKKRAIDPDTHRTLKYVDTFVIPLTINSGIVTVEDVAVARIKNFTLSPKSIREEVGATDVAMNVELETALTGSKAVDFQITAGEGTRDVNYEVEILEGLTIPAGTTKGTAMLRVTPTNNSAVNNPWTFTVQAKVGSESTQMKDAKFTITDDETLSKNITLSVSPGEIKEDAGATTVTVTATLDGKVLDADATIALGLDEDAAGSADRELDYTAMLSSLTIPRGEVVGQTTITVTPIYDGKADNDETITLKQITDNLKNQENKKIVVSTAKITLKDAVMTDDSSETPADTGQPSFGDAALAFEATVGQAFSEVLPAAMGGQGTLMYSVSATLPLGLSFDAATRTLSGTPTLAGMATVVYTAIDSDGDIGGRTFTITVGEAAPVTIGVASVMASQSAVRENGETTEIRVTATLSGAAPAAEMVRFTIVPPASGAMATRDVDYTATLAGIVTIPAGETMGWTTLFLSPIDNAAAAGHKYVGIRAAASGGWGQVDIRISDDETASTSLVLSVMPSAIPETAELTEVMVMAALDGKPLAEDATATISIDEVSSSAMRDTDYSALFDPIITIAAGSIMGSTRLLVNPTADSMAEGDETIILNAMLPGLTSDSATLVLTDMDSGMMDGDEDMMIALAFVEGTSVAAHTYTAGTAITPLVLPVALGGEGTIMYSVSGLPAGLSFDAATRTISGTPDAATDGAVEVTYTAMAGDKSVSLTFAITVNAMLDFVDLGALFGAFGGVGKANPADSHTDNMIQFTINVPANLTLPAVSGGTPPLTYSVSGLPAGLSFDPATRTISGTPTVMGETVATYTVVDASGASQSLPVGMAVVEPPLSAPTNLVAEDYKGADGQGDQGGFVMLSWELSADHKSLDGYRIFRALPVLENEMVPWARVDAVPGVAMGRAIVATLDNVSTRWGIAAERGGRTTHTMAKAVFVEADDLTAPYAQMAKTLQASRNAAQEGPVLASLLPEALAYARGVAPKLNVVSSVLSSSITWTAEAVRATDDIAPLAVSALQVLDAPDDQGGRIALTWTLSPSDQVLQGVVAGALGPAPVEPVVGVHGYRIYRRAVGAEAFSVVAEVEAGRSSFVDETAQHGVHYTYQVRAFDLDNETGSVEHTALAVRNRVADSQGQALLGLFGADGRIGFDDFFVLADRFGLTAGDAGFDPAFDLAPNGTIDFDDFFVLADHFGRSLAVSGKPVPLRTGLNGDARLYLDAPAALPSVGEEFVVNVRLADFVAVKGYGLQVAYDADQLTFVEARTDQPLGGSAFATPQVLADQAGVLTVAAHGDVVSDGELMLRLVFRPTTEIAHTTLEVTDSQTYDRALGFNRLALPAPVSLQTRPAVFSLAANYPNPFNPQTTIQYALPQAADVGLTVYNVLGQPVRTLVAEHQAAGRYAVEWDATNDSGQSVSSGMYFYRLQAGGDFLDIKKMLLLK